jgi:hypothetical protein
MVIVVVVAVAVVVVLVVVVVVVLVVLSILLKYLTPLNNSTFRPVTLATPLLTIFRAQFIIS